MVEFVHIGAVLPATVGICCTLTSRERRARALVPGAVMLLAMLDLSVGPGLILPLLWAAIMVGLAVWTVMGVRPRGSGRGRSHGRSHMPLHRALGLVVMAALTVLMATPGAAAAGIGGAVVGAASVASAQHHHAASGLLVPIVAAGVAGYLAYTLWLAVVAMRERSVLVRVDAASMGVMAAVMGVALLV